uniref:PawS-like 1 albumin n=1 Tax=Ratibida columnifera TaxID=53728 RepID=A0A5B8YNX2_RATCO|nr:PawS-like 1 albumin precursor [Ratibida columnifera]
MAKVVVVALAMAAMILAFDEVAGYTTTTTTTTEDNGSRIWVPGLGPVYEEDGLDNRRGSCQIQIQELSHCQMHLTSPSFDYRLRMAVENPKQQQHLDLCCNQLRQVGEECQCEAIKQLVGRQLQKKQGYGKQQVLEQIAKKAQMLSNQCNLQCSI